MKTFLTSLPVAHRGLHDETKPENSLAAYRAAAELGYAIETDVHFSKDGVIVVMHDDCLRRMTGDGRQISDCTLAELKELRLGGTEERIPTLDELLETVGGKVPLLIEIKNMAGVKGKDIALPLAEKLDAYGGEYAIQSFQPFYVKAYKKIRPSIPCGILAMGKAGKESFGGSRLWKFKSRMMRTLWPGISLKPDFVSYCFGDLPVKEVERFREKGKPVLAWTIRSEQDEAYARKYADNVIFEKHLAKK